MKHCLLLGVATVIWLFCWLLGWINKRREVIVLGRQGTQQQRPESPTVTPTGMQVNTSPHCMTLVEFMTCVLSVSFTTTSPKEFPYQVVDVRLPENTWRCACWAHEDETGTDKSAHAASEELKLKRFLALSHSDFDPLPLDFQSNASANQPWTLQTLRTATKRLEVLKVCCHLAVLCVSKYRKYTGTSNGRHPD